MLTLAIITTGLTIAALAFGITYYFASDEDREEMRR